MKQDSKTDIKPCKSEENVFWSNACIIRHAYAWNRILSKDERFNAYNGDIPRDGLITEFKFEA